MKEKRIEELKKDKVAELLMDFIPNNLGINLCSVKDIYISRQFDKQLKEIRIVFKPMDEKHHQMQKIIEDWQAIHPSGKKIECYRDTGISRPTIDKYWVEKGD